MLKKKSNKTTVLRYASTPYTQIPDGLWVCPEFNLMSPHSRCLFMLMLAKWNPYKPKQEFVLTYDEIQKITKFNRHRISKSITELMKEGFIEIPTRGCFPHNISTYRINIRWIEKAYPKKPQTLPEYLEQFLAKDKQ